MDDRYALTGSVDQMLREAVARVVGSGEEPMAVALTTRDVAELGVYAVKVIVPGAVPLSPDHRFPLLGSRRLTETPWRIGYTATPTRLEDLNLRIPHPFA
jgi:ribosomal protein S12 methylthiotransferase accessory factor